MDWSVSDIYNRNIVLKRWIPKDFHKYKRGEEKGHEIYTKRIIGFYYRRKDGRGYTIG